MKKILTSILLFVLCFLNAQNVNFKSLDSIGFVNTCTKVLSDTALDFKLDFQDESNFEKYIIYENSKGENLMIVYNVIFKGENKDLEIKGTKVWNITAISSKYLTVFNLYQTYFNARADKEKIQKDGLDFNSPPQARLRKTSIEGFWEIKIH